MLLRDKICSLSNLQQIHEELILMSVISTGHQVAIEKVSS